MYTPEVVVENKLTQKEKFNLMALAEVYLQDRVDRSELNLASAKTYHKAFVKLNNFFCVNRISDPTADVLQSFKRSLMDEGVRATTLNLYLVAIRGLFAFISKRLGIENIANELKGVKTPNIQRRQAPSTGQVQDIIKSIDTNTLEGKRAICLVLLMAETGLRRSECANLDVGDMVSISGRYYLCIKGKGHFEKDSTVKLSPMAVEKIRDYLTARGKVSSKAPLFISHSNNGKGQRLTPTSISVIIKSLFKSIGIDNPELTAHSLRHYSCTEALRGGVDYVTLMNHMRHKSFQTTLRYAHTESVLSNPCVDLITQSIWSSSTRRAYIQPSGHGWIPQHGAGFGFGFDLA